MLTHVLHITKNIYCWNRPSMPILPRDVSFRMMRRAERERKYQQRQMIMGHSQKWYKQRRGKFGRSLRNSYKQ